MKTKIQAKPQTLRGDDGHDTFSIRIKHSSHRQAERNGQCVRALQKLYHQPNPGGWCGEHGNRRSRTTLIFPLFFPLTFSPSYPS